MDICIDNFTRRERRPRRSIKRFDNTKFDKSKLELPFTYNLFIQNVRWSDEGAAPYRFSRQIWNTIELTLSYQYMSILYKGLDPIRVSVLCVKMTKG